MRALRIAVAMVRIPRLFVSLLLFPLLLSLVFVYVQLVVTGVFLKATTRNADEFAQTVENLNQKSFRRALLYGDEGPLPPLVVCRWSEQELPDQGRVEAPPDGDCALHKLDVTLQVKNPAAFDAREYVKIMDGNVRRLHICKSCRSGAIIKPVGRKIRTDVDSVWGLWALQLARFNTHVQQRWVEAAVEVEHTHKMFGDTYLHSSGFRDEIRVTGIGTLVAVLMNIALLIIVALFLALKAHRKVLDYFAKNGALLPMVAATGNQVFYGAIWILTAFRVGAFLLAAVPLTYFGFDEMLREKEYRALFAGAGAEIALWMATLAISLALATLVASISDLKQRHSVLSFTYKYLPLLLSLVGSVVWAATFLADGQAAGMVRNITAALPVFGLTPLLVAPVFKPDLNAIAVHAILAAGLLAVMLKYNARWFAAHLEDL
jgi:hypothetical protein